MKDKASGLPAEAGLVMRHPGCDVQRQNYGVIRLSWECLALGALQVPLPQICRMLSLHRHL